MRGIGRKSELRFANTITSVVVTTMLVGLVAFGLPVGRITATVPLKSESQVKNEAAVYDAAIRQINSVSSQNLSNPDNLKKALPVLEQQLPNLRFNRSKLVALGIANTAFVNAVKSKAHDSKSGTELAKQLAKDPSSIFNIDGALSVKDQVLRSFESDTALLLRLAGQLKQASVDINSKAKAHHAAGFHERQPLVTPLSPERLSDAQVTTVVVLVAVVICPPLAIGLFDLAGIASVAAAVILVARLVANLSSDKGKDRVVACMDPFLAKLQACLDAAHKLFFPFDIAAEAACAAEFDLAALPCLVTD